MFVGQLTIAPGADQAFVEMLQRDGKTVVVSAISENPGENPSVMLSVIEARCIDPEYDVICTLNGPDAIYLMSNATVRARNIVRGLNAIGGGTFRVGLRLHLGPKLFSCTTYDQGVL